MRAAPLNRAPHPPNDWERDVSDQRIRIFLVEGEGDFPFDMLVCDQCWPQAAADAMEVGKRPLAESRNRLYRQVRLATTNEAGPNRMAWTERHWHVID